MFNKIKDMYQRAKAKVQRITTQDLQKDERTDAQKALEDAGILYIKPNRAQRRSFRHGNRVRSRSSRKSSTFATKKGAKRDTSGLVRNAHLIHDAVNSKRSVLQRMGFRVSQAFQ